MHINSLSVFSSSDDPGSPIVTVDRLHTDYKGQSGKGTIVVTIKSTDPNENAAFNFFFRSDSDYLRFKNSIINSHEAFIKEEKSND